MSDLNKNLPTNEFDFSNMSLDDLLNSVHADLGDLPPAEAEETAAPKTERAPEPASAAVAVLERPADPDGPTGELPVVSPPKAKRERAKKSTAAGDPGLSRFWKGVLIYASAFVLVIAVALVVFWNFMTAYERSRPETAVQNLIDAAGEDYWLDGVRAAAFLSVTEFEDEGQIVDKFLLSAIRGQELSFRKFSAEYTDQAPIYIISAGSTDFCRVDLSVAEGRTAGFGFSLWQVSKVELLESFLALESHTVSLNVKEDSTVLLNGVPVSLDYVLPDNDRYVADYCIEGIYDDYTVEVFDAGGEPEEPINVSGDSYFFPVPGKTEFTFSISAPAGASVTVGDVALGEDSIVSTGGTYPVFDSVESLLELDILSAEVSRELGRILEAQPTIAEYRYSVYDYERPSVTVLSVDGSVMEGVEAEDGVFYFAPGSDSAPDGEIADRAEEFIRRYVNFSANVGNDPWANQNAITPYLLKGSDLYSRIVNSTAAMEWVSGRTVTYNYMELGNFAVYGDLLATCRVSFGLNNITYYGTQEMESCYDLALVNVDGAWRVVGMAEVE